MHSTGMGGNAIKIDGVPMYYIKHNKSRPGLLLPLGKLRGTTNQKV